MTLKIGPLRLLLVILALVMACQAQWKKTPLQRPSYINPNLYPANANANKEIKEATITAAKTKKRILLVFGANWCLDCHVLDHAFHQPRVAPLLEQNFLVVHVDVGEYTKNLDLAKKYNVNLNKGVPSIAVIDARGTVLNSTSEFEKARSLSEEDLIVFLDKWRPSTSGH